MKPNRRLFFALIFLFLPGVVTAQVRLVKEFQIIKVTKNFTNTPQFVYGGADQHVPAVPAAAAVSAELNRWLEVEVEFATTPVMTDELTVKYFVLFNGNLFSGSVTHVNVPAGRDRRSIMYMAPRTLARYGGNRPITLNSVPNVAVQIVQQGAVKDEVSLARAQPQWYAALPQISGLLLNKNETPFAPLYWDRYEQIKTSGR
jgi:hypothetical protein